MEHWAAAHSSLAGEGKSLRSSEHGWGLDTHSLLVSPGDLTVSLLPAWGRPGCCRTHHTRTHSAVPRHGAMLRFSSQPCQTVRAWWSRWSRNCEPILAPPPPPPPPGRGGRRGAPPPPPPTPPDPPTPPPHTHTHTHTHTPSLPLPPPSSPLSPASLPHPSPAVCDRHGWPAGQPGGGQPRRGVPGAAAGHQGGGQGTSVWGSSLGFAGDCWGWPRCLHRCFACLLGQAWAGAGKQGRCVHRAWTPGPAVSWGAASI